MKGTNKRFFDGGDELWCFVITDDILGECRVEKHHVVDPALEMGRKAREWPSVLIESEAL